MRRRGFIQRSSVSAPAFRPTVMRGGLLAALLAGVGGSVGFAVAPGGMRAGRAAPSRSALSGMRLWVDPASDAARQADTWRRSRPDDAALMDMVAAQPTAQWLGEWTSDPGAAIASAMARSGRSGSVPVFVLYAIPKRDCGGFSAGGVRGDDAYRSFVQRVAEGLGGGPAVVVVEPDALAGMSCLSRADRDGRLRLVAGAIQTLKAGGANVYVDAGNPGWVPAADMAARLRVAGIDRADGFALNVSNFYTTPENVAYGRAISAAVGGKHFLIDTSRNGAGAAPGQWCNPAGRALGAAPTTGTGQPLVDAYLWVKRPGQSDGTCNGGPKAGKWWPEYALGLARRATAGSAADGR